MTITSITSREFNQHTSRAKKATDKGRVFITDRGCSSHVLLSIKEYQQFTEDQQKITDLLAMPSIEELEFKITALRDHAQPAVLS